MENFKVGDIVYIRENEDIFVIEGAIGIINEIPGDDTIRVEWEPEFSRPARLDRVEGNCWWTGPECIEKIGEL